MDLDGSFPAQDDSRYVRQEANGNGGEEKEDGDDEEEDLRRNDGEDNDHESNDDDDDDEGGGGGGRSKSLLGFLFGNVDGSGDLDEEYLDQDAKEHLSALADQLGQSLVDIDLSVGRDRSGLTTEDDYRRKADDAVDFKDIEEQYEGPEEHTQTEDAISKDEHFFTQAALAAPSWKTSAFVPEEENYDEDDGDNESEAKFEAEPESHLIAQGQNLPPAGVKHEDAGEHFSPEDLNKAEEKESDGLIPVVTEPLHDLPVLCIEDGKEVLKFSELFGHQDPSWSFKSEIRQYQRPVLKGKTGEVEAQLLEDDEAVLLKSLTVRYDFRDDHVSDDNDEEEDTEEEKGDTGTDEEKVDIECKWMQSQAREQVHHWASGLPMKEDKGEWDCVFVESRMVSSHNLNLLHQTDWEKNIIWDNDLRYVRADAVDIAKDFSSPNAEDKQNVDDREISDMCVENGLLLSQADTNSSGREGDRYHGQNHLLRACVIEPLTSASPLSSRKVERVIRHPQMLRLEAKVDAISNSESCNSRLSEIRHKLRKMMYEDADLSSGNWINQIIWDGTSLNTNVNAVSSKIIFDLQDDQMVFEIPDSKEGQRYRAHAAAMVIAPHLKTSVPEAGDTLNLGLSSSTRFNISNDKYYMNKKAPQQHKSNAKKRAAHGIKVMHSLPAIKFQTLKPKLSNKDLANFHRPKAVWYPHHNEVAAKEQGPLFVQGPMKVILKSMGGKGSKLQVDASETVASVKAKASKKLGDLKSSEKTKIFYSGKELEESRTLAEQGVPPNSVLHLVRTKVYPWPKAQRLPGENKPLRPPGAFKKKSELSLKDGHAALMEYCEERPLLLGNVGMGSRLSTYYRKITSMDSTAATLRNEKGPWIGATLPLEPMEESPFLGNIRPGEIQSCIETSMYRAPIFAHKVPSTDYLLVRSAKGKLSLRRIDSIHAVGQQEPHIEVFTPGSKTVHNFLGNRLLVYMYRAFRDSEKPGSNPRVRYDEVTAHFPTLSEGYMRKRLKHCTDLQRDKNGELWWIMRKNFRIPSEEEIRRIMTAENVCAYESMQAGLYHLKRMGVHKLTQPSGISGAMNQLPDEAIVLAAASHVERELQITPWNLSCNFVSATLQGRGSIERLEITGAGDPSGRALGFSYLRVPAKAPGTGTGSIVQKKAAAARGGGAVTGTDADLRRLSMEAAREVLLKFKVPEEQIDKLTRWHRIALVRKLSSEQAAAASLETAGVSVLNKFARGQRMSFLQLQQQAREKCQEIWDRQAQSLMAADGEVSDNDVEGNEDLDSFAGDLENLLEAEGEEKEITSSDVGKKEIVKGTGARRRALEAQREEEIEDEEAEAAELRRMLREDDEAEEDKKRKKNTGTGKDKKVQDEKLKIPISNLEDSNVNGVKKKMKVIKRIIRTKKSDGTYSLKEIRITDPKEIAQYLAKKNASQNGMMEKGMKKSIISGKKGVIAIDNNMAVQKMATVNKLIKKGKGARDGLKVVCGACGMIGHMRTNKKVCPMYRDDGDAYKQAKEPVNIEVLGEKEAVNSTVKERDHVDGEEKNQDAQEGPVKEPKQVKFPSLKIKLPVGGHVELGSGSHNRVKETVSDIGPEENDVKRLAFPKNPEGGTTKFKIKKFSLPKNNVVEELRTDNEEMHLVAETHSGNDASPSENTDKNLRRVSYGRNWQSEKGPKVNPAVERERTIQKEREDAEMYQKIAEEEITRKKREEEEIRWRKKRRKQMKRLMEQEEKRRRDEDERQRLEMEREAEWRLELERQAEIERQALLKREAELQRQEYLERQEQMERAREKRERESRRYREHQRLQEQQTVSGIPKLKRSISSDRQSQDKDKMYSNKRRTSAELGSSRVSSEYQQHPKRRKGGEVMLANILEGIVDSLKKSKEVSYLFLKPVSKKEAPDYLDVIRNPMDLSTIREKTRKLVYKSRDEFRQDVWQIAENAHIYNDHRNPGIPPLADSLLSLCDHVLELKDRELTEAESAVEVIEQGNICMSVSPPTVIERRRMKRHR